MACPGESSPRETMAVHILHLLQVNPYRKGRQLGTSDARRSGHIGRGAFALHQAILSTDRQTRSRTYGQDVNRKPCSMKSLRRSLCLTGHFRSPLCMNPSRDGFSFGASSSCKCSTDSLSSLRGRCHADGDRLEELSVNSPLTCPDACMTFSYRLIE